MRSTKLASAVAISLLALVLIAPGQTRRRSKPKKAAPVPVQPAPAPVVIEPEPEAKVPTKRNERPGSGSKAPAPAAKAAIDPTYVYTFISPQFLVREVRIEHDDAGRGTISFRKREYDETFTDPIQISAAAMERINAALAELNFLASTENYQYERDYPHLGNITFRYKHEGREREVKFNWTEVKGAKALKDEYRRISNQFIWMFDIGVAHDNQPLETPRLLDLLDGYVRQNEISDGGQVAAFLRTVQTDERYPLIARNHATRLIKRIETAKK